MNIWWAYVIVDKLNSISGILCQACLQQKKPSGYFPYSPLSK